VALTSNPTSRHPVKPINSHNNLLEAVAMAMHQTAATINNLLTSSNPHHIKAIKIVAVDAGSTKDTILHNSTQISTNNNNTTLIQMLSHAVGEVDEERLHSMAHLRNSDASCISPRLNSKAISTRVNTSTPSLRKKFQS
jgi:hypothetical protein